MNSKRIIELDVKPKSIKFLEENIRENICDLELGKDFLEVVLKQFITEKKNNKVDFIKIKNCLLKDILKKLKWQVIGWEKCENICILNM